MTIKEHYPILFDTDEIYYPKSFSIDEQVVETVNQTEAGTDQIQLIRTGKIKISYSTTCKSKYLNLFKQYSRKASFTVKYYDTELEGYATKTVRLRGLKYSLSQSSYDLENVDGVYNVSFTLEEF